MKKLWIITVSLLISALFFSAAPASADSKDGGIIQKVYYSEPLGTADEEKVYHITACKKAPAYAVLRCSKEVTDANGLYTFQCIKNGKMQDGEPIRGCLKSGGLSENEDKPFPAIDKKKPIGVKSPDGCSDKPEEQGFVYAQEWAVVDKTKAKSQDDQTQWKSIGTVAWETTDSEKVPKELIKAVDPQEDKNAESKAEAVGLYRSVLCTSWDIFDKAEDSKNPREKPSDSETKLRDLIKKETSGASESIANKLASKDLGCNNSNANDNNGALDKTLEVSTPYNLAPSVSCTTQYLITGKSGTEIFGKYIKRLYNWAAGIVGIVAVLTIVYSGIQISMAGADTAKLDSAKNRIMQSIIGLALLFLASLILYTINPTFFT